MRHILLVEDDPLNIIIFKKILEKRGGFAVTHSEDVPEILTLCKSGDIDLVVMDISLTKSSWEGAAVDGVRITQLIKSDDQSTHLPVILATAHAMRGDQDRFMADSGANGYITKPITDHAGFISLINDTLAETVLP